MSIDDRKVDKSFPVLPSLLGILHCLEKMKNDPFFLSRRLDDRRPPVPLEIDRSSANCARSSPS